MTTSGSNVLPFITNCPRASNTRIIVTSGSAAWSSQSSVSVVRSASDKGKDRGQSLAAVDPQNPQEVARHFKEHGSQFGDEDFSGTDTWHDAIDRVAQGGPTLDE